MLLNLNFRNCQGWPGIMFRNTAILFLFVTSLLWSAGGYAQLHPEQRLIEALQAIQHVKLDKAERLLKKLIQDEPEFKLAYMLYADILKARAHPLGAAGMGLKKTGHWQQLIDEARARWQANRLDDPTRKIPMGLSRLDNNYDYAIVVDLNQARLFVFENSEDYPRQIASYFISMGRGGPQKEKQGDLRTPLGVYFVQSYIPPEKLADKYGAGAYPINYPNAWDVFNGRTGYGIWLHGTRSGTYNRPPLASEGCVVLPNSDLLRVGDYITLGETPVIIGHDMQWVSPDKWKQQQQQVSGIFEQWLEDWGSLNTGNYLRHYSKAFSNGAKNYSDWVEHKQRVARYKTFIDVDASHVSLLMHPNDDVLVATFQQHYHSDNYSGSSWKRQYWRKEADGRWRIIFEGRITPPVTPQLARTEDMTLDTAN